MPLFLSWNCQRRDQNSIPLPGRPRGLLPLGGCRTGGSRHSPSAHLVAAPAPHTGAHGVPRLPTPAPRPHQHRQISSHIAAPVLMSPAHTAALSPPARQDRQHAASARTSSPGGHRALRRHAASPVRGHGAHWGHAARQGAVCSSPLSTVQLQADVLLHCCRTWMQAQPSRWVEIAAQPALHSL